MLRASSSIRASRTRKMIMHMATDMALPRLRPSQPIIDDVYQRGTVPSADGAKRRMTVYIPREEGYYLYTMVRRLRPQLTVEVGMANGLSSLFIAEALRDNGQGRHIAVDPFQFADWH